MSIDESCPIVNTPLRMLPGIFSGLDVKILSIFRDNEIVIPTGKVEIYPGDDIYICIRNSDLLRALRVFGIKFQENRKIVVIGAGNVGLNLIKILANDIIEPGEVIIRNKATASGSSNPVKYQKSLFCLNG